MVYMGEVRGIVYKMEKVTRRRDNWGREEWERG